MNDLGRLSHQSSLAARFARMQQAARSEMYPPFELRVRRLETLERLLRDNADALADAIRRDFGHRSVAEARLLELFPCYAVLVDALGHVRCWMRPQRRFQPGRAELRYQPLVAVGIVVPWNSPIFLAVAPPVAALAAGNHVLIKMSELTPLTSRLFANLIARNFADDEVSVVEGDAEVAQIFSQLLFDHLLFTGSTPVGHHVMRAASDNLTPVTLELGGKSPAIIGEAARRLIRCASIKCSIKRCPTINDTLLHIAQDDLPFGGVGPSGMGCYHGFEGFRTFSAQKSVFRE